MSSKIIKIQKMVNVTEHVIQICGQKYLLMFITIS